MGGGGAHRAQGLITSGGVIMTSQHCSKVFLRLRCCACTDVCNREVEGSRGMGSGQLGKKLVHRLRVATVVGGRSTIKSHGRTSLVESPGCQKVREDVHPLEVVGEFLYNILDSGII